MRGRLALLGPDVDAELIADQSTFIDSDDGRRELGAFVDHAFEVWSGQAGTQPPGRPAIDLLVATMTEPIELRSMLRNEIAGGEREVVQLTRGQYRAAQHASEPAAGRHRRRRRDRQDDARGREGAAAREGRVPDAARVLQLAAVGDAGRRGRGGRARRPACSRSRRSTSSARTWVARRACCRRDPSRSRRSGGIGRCRGALDEAAEKLGPRYHAIVVDEGQDFDAEWLAVARGAAGRRPRRRPVRLPRPRAGDLPRRRRSRNSACRRTRSRRTAGTRSRSTRSSRRLSQGGLVGEALRTDGRAPEFIEAGRRRGDRRGAAEACSIDCGSTRTSCRGTSRC